MILFLCITATISALWAIASAFQLFPQVENIVLGSLLSVALLLGALTLAELPTLPGSALTGQRTPVASSMVPQLELPNPSATP